MTNEKIAIYTLAVSLAAHVLVIGGGAFFGAGSTAEKDALEIAHMPFEKPALLPEIKVIGKIKNFKDESEKETPPKRVPENQLRAGPEIINVLDKQAREQISKEIPVRDLSQEAMLRYQDAIKQKIESCRSYPFRARTNKTEGSVDLQFRVSNDGRADNIFVLRSSGSEILDRESINTVRRAQPFLPLPPDIGQKHVTIYVSLVYSLD
ncbi:MAG: TonB family protein [Candidatus Omnitrophota bacterium]